MTISIKDHAAIDHLLYKIYTLQDLDGFIVTAMRELPALIESDTIGYNEVDYAGQRMMTIVDSPIVQKRYHERQLVFEAIMRQNPLIDHYATVLDGPKKITDFISTEQWRATALYRAYYGTIGAEYQIAVALPVEEVSLVAFAFNRSQSDFSERHRAILATLQPHLTLAYINARDHTRVQNSLKHSEQALETIGAGWMDLDHNLNVITASSLGRSNLESFFENSQISEGKLPPEAHKWVADHIGSARTGVPIAPLVINNRNGRLIVRLLATGPSGECSLLTERFVDANSSESLVKLGLTNRQAEVLYWICLGKSNAEIAILLKISVRTVTFHVSHILETLDAANRTEAANFAMSHLTSRR